MKIQPTCSITFNIQFIVFNIQGLSFELRWFFLRHELFPPTGPTCNFLPFQVVSISILNYFFTLWRTSSVELLQILFVKGVCFKNLPIYRTSNSYDLVSFVVIILMYNKVELKKKKIFLYHSNNGGQGIKFPWKHICLEIQVTFAEF